MSETLAIEVAIAWPETQVLVEVEVPPGSTVADAIRAADIAKRFPDQPIDQMPVGIWGRQTGREHRLANGDRVEIYRELEMDPRDARRELAESGKTMSS